MTFQEIATMVNSTGINNRYDHYTTNPAPPYVVFYIPAYNDFKADDSNYCGRAELHIELFCKTRDTAKETLIETKLRANDLTWYKSVDYINDEKVYQTTYEMEVLLNG